MPVEELLCRMSSYEFTEWQAYATLEPFGEERADLRAGIIAATIANANRDPKKNPRRYMAQDFIPKFGPQREPSADALLLKAKMAAALTGGRIEQ